MKSGYNIALDKASYVLHRCSEKLNFLMQGCESLVDKAANAKRSTEFK